MHQDPVAPVVAALAVMLLVAKIGGELATRMKQPAVLGELVAGIFANVGAGLMLNGVPVIAPSVFSAIVAMVVVTTMVTPPALQWSLSRRPRS